MTQSVEESFLAHYRRYGSSRLVEELRYQGYPVSRYQVQQLILSREIDPPQTANMGTLDKDAWLLDGILCDEIILLAVGKDVMKARLITFRLLTTGKIYKFISNMFDVSATTIAKLY